MANFKKATAAVVFLADASLAVNVTGNCYETAPASQHYALNWKAEGKGFFDDFGFAEGFSPTHGVAYYTNKGEAISRGLATADDTHATIRVEGQHADASRGPRRNSVKIFSNRKWQYFLAALKFNHIPYGMGIWPAFWMFGGQPWPNNGELDIIEIVNHVHGQTSFHTGGPNHCKLDAGEVNKCGGMPDGNNMNYDCFTNYPKQLGCAPNKAYPMQNSDWWNSNPGVIVTEWTDRFVKVFLIPEKDIPSDLNSESPKPETWNEAWVISYYPFAASEAKYPGSCPNPAHALQPQQFIFNIELCGDWGSWTFNPVGNDPFAAEWQQKMASGQCKKNRYYTPDDCCCQYINQEKMNDYIGKNAYFDVSYLKVFQLSAGPAPGPTPPTPAPPGPKPTPRPPVPGPTPSPTSPSPAACGAHPGCTGLIGDCCPQPGGHMLACCNAPAPPGPKPTPPPTSPSPAACGAHPGCKGLIGDCCPQPGGHVLSCCNAPAPPPSPPTPAACSAHPFCAKLIGDCCPMPGGVILSCCNQLGNATSPAASIVV